MTDRIAWVTVLLDRDYRTDDAEEILAAIRMIKGRGLGGAWRARQYKRPHESGARGDGTAREVVRGAQGDPVMLYKLPNGNWIDPALVTGIKILLPVFTSDGKECNERVRIELVGGDQQVITPEDCYGWADEFAAVCNRAKADAKP